MPTIQHQIHIKSSKSKVQRALGTVEGIASWWTTTTEGESTVGKTLGFRFGEHVTTAEVTALTDSHVAWTVQDSAPDWVGTQIAFDLTEAEGVVSVRFTHSNWQEQNDFFGHCSMKWATFLLSLRDELEHGKGRPFPNDVAI